MDAQDLLAELRFLRTTLERLLTQAEAVDPDWRPAPQMRSVLELANHVAQIPAVDLAIAQEQPREQVQALEHSLTRPKVGELLAVWDQGYAAVEAYFSAMDPTEFETRVTSAFYDYKATQKKWLLDFVTHTYHHRAQLFTYLKMLGRPIDMFTLY